MQCYQLYQQMDPQVATDMFLFFRDKERDIYKTAISTLAQERKLRAEFVTKKSVADQIAWALKTLRIKTNNMIGEHLLQVFFIKAHEALLVTFLDAAGIEHDGEGQIDELPESLDATKLKAAVDAIIDQYGAPLSAVYLHLFQMQTNQGWSELAEILNNDARVKLSA